MAPTLKIYRTLCLQFPLLLLLRLPRCLDSLSQFAWRPVAGQQQQQPLEEGTQPGSNTRAWWSTARLYKIFVPTFQDTDGDGLGDLQGVTTKLEWIQGMGMDGIILSSIFESASHTTDEWADVRDFRNVDIRFGGLQRLQDLLDEAHKLGMKVILEWTPNHSSDQHAWFQRAIQADATPAERDMYVWKPADTPTPNWVSFYGKHLGSSFNMINVSNSTRQEYYHAFLPTEPDLNYRNTDVRGNMSETLISWLDLGVDGFSVTGAEYLFEAVSGDGAWANETPTPHCYVANDCKDFQLFEEIPHEKTQNLKENLEVIQDWRSIMDSYGQGATERVLIGNFLESLADVNTSWWLGPKDNPGFHAVLAPTLQTASSQQDVAAAMGQYISKLPVGAMPAWTLGGFSSMRLGTKLHNASAAAAMLAFVGLLPGLAVFTYADAILMLDGSVPFTSCKDPRCLLDKKGNFTTTGRDSHRTPMQWNASANAGFSTANTSQLYLPVVADYKSRNAMTELSKAIYRNLSAAINVTDVRPTLSDRPLGLNVQVIKSNVLLAAYSNPLAVRRHSGGICNDTVILMNLGDQNASLSWSQLQELLNPSEVNNTHLKWEVRFSLHNAFTPKQLLDKSMRIVLPPNEVAVFSWWFYGANGVMGPGHWVWFSMLVLMSAFLVMNGFGVLFYYVQRVCTLCCAPRLPSVEADPNWAETLPSIAVVVPCYMPNEKAIIEETLDHILNNVLYEFAVDPGPGPSSLSDDDVHVSVYCFYNGSDSNTHRVEDTLAEWNGKRHGRFNRLLHCQLVETSHSKAENLNAAFEQINDPYVVIYDADHHPDPQSLRIAMRTMLSRGTGAPLDCVQGSTYIRDGGCWFMRHFIDCEFFINYFYNFPSMQTITRTGWFGGSNAVWRMDFLRTQQFHHQMQCEDIDYSVRAMLQSAQMKFVPESRSGELAPATMKAFYRQRRRWALGWEEVTLKYMRSIGAATDIGCCRKCGMLYLLPMRWPLIIVNAIVLYAGIALNVWFFFYQRVVMPDRYVSWGVPIDVVNKIALGSSMYNLVFIALLALLYEPTFCRKVRSLVYVIIFLNLGPFYLLWQAMLIIVSHRILCKGIRLAWVPTTRGTVAENCDARDLPASNFGTVTSVMCSFVPRDGDEDTTVAGEVHRERQESDVSMQAQNTRRSSD